MQTLYSVSVQAVEPGDAAFEAIQDKVVAWAFPYGDVPGGLTSSSGVTYLEEKRITWDIVSVADGLRLWSLEVCTPLLETADAEFVCAVAVGQTADRVGFHVDLGRRTAEARVAPARLEFVARPRIVPAVLSVVPCQYRPGEPVAAAPRRVRAADLPAVIELLADPNRRLPVLVVSTTASGSAEARFAMSMADKLAGLAHVVLLETWLALDALNSENRMTVPVRGARLFWPPTPGADKHPWWTADQLRDAADVAERVFTMLSRLSVMANARNRIAETVRQAERDAARQAARRAAQRRVDEAVAAGDKDQTIKALTAQLDAERALNAQLEADRTEAWQLAVDLDEENQQLRHYKANYEAMVAYQPAVVESEPPREGLEVSPDFRELWPALETETDGALVFTDHARASWAGAGYPYPDRMRDALEKLALAAVEWRRLGGNLGMSLTSWITQQVGLQYAADDEGMRRAKVAKFDYGRRTYDRVAHIKLDDHVSPDRVGRIYFGIDREEKRWIVDHVGVKIFTH